MAKRKKVITEEMVNSTRAIRAVVAIKDSLLPDDIKVRAIKDIVFMVDRDSHLLGTSELIQLDFEGLFWWNDSQEGHHFWDKVHEIVGKF